MATRACVRAIEGVLDEQENAVCRDLAPQETQDIQQFAFVQDVVEHSDGHDDVDLCGHVGDRVRARKIGKALGVDLRFHIGIVAPNAQSGPEQEAREISGSAAEVQRGLGNFAKWLDHALDYCEAFQLIICINCTIVPAGMPVRRIARLPEFPELFIQGPTSLSAV